MQNQAFGEDFESLARKAFNLVDRSPDTHRRSAESAIRFRSDVIGVAAPSAAEGVRGVDDGAEVLCLEDSEDRLYLQETEDGLVGVVVPNKGVEIELQTPGSTLGRKIPDETGSFEFGDVPKLYRLVIHMPAKTWCTPWRV